MPASDTHHHALARIEAPRRRLIIAGTLTLAVLIAEVIGSWLTGSLALLADAGHMLTDVAGTGFAILAMTLGARPATAQRTYGFARLEILAAVVNGMLLFGIAGFLMIEAWQRWNAPTEVRGIPMLAFAVVGAVVNVISLMILRGDAKASINVRGAYLEALGDLLGSAAVIVAAIVIAVTGWQRADLVASIAVALMILPRTWSLLREAIDILLEAAPRNIDLTKVREHIDGVSGVMGTHDLHVWTLTSGMPVLSVHVVVGDDVFASGESGRVLDDLTACLADHFDVAHCTFQIEPASHAQHEAGLHH